MAATYIIIIIVDEPSLIVGLSLITNGRCERNWEPKNPNILYFAVTHLFLLSLNTLRPVMELNHRSLINSQA